MRSHAFFFRLFLRDICPNLNRNFVTLIWIWLVATTQKLYPKSLFRPTIILLLI